VTDADAPEATQDRLRRLVVTETDDPRTLDPRSVAGLDVAYETGGERLAAAVVVLDPASFEVLESVSVTGRAALDYRPGLFAFRELPPLVEALERLTTVPDLLVCDGQGVAHPRRFGLASHLGVRTGLPSIGVAKQPLIGTWDAPAEPRGSWSPLKDGDEVVGRVLRSQTGVRPVFVSVGHRIDLRMASDLVLRLSPSHRLPETTRLADHLARQALKAAGG
jgi:deoxyribonuclease V